MLFLMFVWSCTLQLLVDTAIKLAGARGVPDAADLVRQAALQWLCFKYDTGTRFKYIHNDEPCRSKRLKLDQAAKCLAEAAAAASSTAAGSAASRRSRCRPRQHTHVHVAAAVSIHVLRKAGDTYLYEYTYSPSVSQESDFMQLSLDWFQQLGARPIRTPLYVWRRTGDPEQGLFGRLLWVVVDISLAGDGLGVYAARCFAKDGVIGVYGGDVLGPSDLMQQQVDDLPQDDQYDALITLAGHVVSGKHSPHGAHTSDIKTGIRTPEGGSRVLFPRASVGWPGMFAHLMNAGHARHTHINVRVCEPDGLVITNTAITSVYRPGAGAANAAAELLWDYGEGYWED